MFPEIPTDLTGVEDDQLSQLRDNLLTRIREVAANRRDPEIVGELTQAEVLAALEQATAQLELVKDELAARQAEESGYDERVAELAAQAGVELAADTDSGDETDNDDSDDAASETSDEAAAESEAAAADEKPKPQAVTAAARRPLPAARRHRPKVAEHDLRGLRVTSHAAGFGAPYDGGTPLDRRMVGETLTEMIKKRVKPGQRVVVASASYDYPAERILDQRAFDVNMEKIEAAIGLQRADRSALIASGTLCAPLTPIYDLPGVETADRPVRDALVSFQAARGGVIVGATPRMGDYAHAVGVITADDNAAGGTNAVKHCTRIVCPDFDSIEVDSIYHCTEADNLASRAFPELMSRIDELVRAEQARLADGKLLTRMSALSTAVTGGPIVAGAIYSLAGDIFKAAAGYRSRNRMPDGARLQVFLPAWIVDVLALDIARGPFDRFQTRQQITAILDGFGVTPVFHLDGSATAADGQVFGPQTAGALLNFPDTAEWIIAAPGTFLHLDSGMLELGVVRDSILNSTNDFQIFGETWENVAFVGVESLVVTSEICPSGALAAPADVAGICGT